MGVGGQRHAPAALPPRYPLYRRLGRPQGRSGRVRKISPPQGFDPRTVQIVASRYADCAIAAHQVYRILANIITNLLVPKKGREFFDQLSTVKEHSDP